MMPPQNSIRRRAALSAIAASAFLAPALVTASPAFAGCVGPQGHMDCNKTVVTGGGSGGGGGTGGSGGGGGGAGGSDAVPPPIDLNPNQAIGNVAVPGGTAPVVAAPPNTFLLVQHAMDTVSFPVPKVHTAPNGKTYVRVRTSLWVDGFNAVQTDPITVGAQTIQAKATPESVTWDLGEKKLTCDDAGSKDGTTCNYTYQRSSAAQPGGAYQITATITWKAHWTCTGDDCQGNGGDLAPQQQTSVPTPLIVGEIQTTTGQ